MVSLVLGLENLCCCLPLPHHLLCCPHHRKALEVKGRKRLMGLFIRVVTPKCGGLGQQSIFLPTPSSLMVSLDHSPMVMYDGLGVVTMGVLSIWTTCKVSYVVRSGG